MVSSWRLPLCKRAIGSEIGFSICLVFSVESCIRWLQKLKDSLSRSVSLLIGILKCWQLYLTLSSLKYNFMQVVRSHPLFMCRVCWYSDMHNDIIIMHVFGIFSGFYTTINIGDGHEVSYLTNLYMECDEPARE